MSCIKSVVIPVAGLGTRFFPFAKAVPKELVPVLGVPGIHYLVREAVEAGISHVVFVTALGKEAISKYFHIDEAFKRLLSKKKIPLSLALEELLSWEKKIQYTYVHQEAPKGLGHAIGCAKRAVGNDPFAVLLGDDWIYDPKGPPLGKLLKCFEEKKASVLGIGPVPLDQVSCYGIIDGSAVGEGRYQVSHVIEKPSIKEAPSRLAILGRYVFTSEIFDHLEKILPGKNGEIQLTDAIAKLSPLWAQALQGRRFDLGTPKGVFEASLFLASKDPELQSVLKTFLKAT